MDKQSTIKDLSFIAFITLVSTFLIWLPFIFSLPNFLGLNFSDGFQIIYKNYDALEYLVIAKSFYDPQLIAQIPTAMTYTYYPAHFPGFPIIINLFAPLFGFIKSALFVSLLFSILSGWVFYLMVKDLKLTTNPLILTLVFLFLPARWLIIRSIPAPESMFIFFTITSLYLFMKATLNDQIKHKFIWFSAIMASFAQLTKPPGNLLAIALFLYLVWYAFHTKKNVITYLIKFYPFLLVPLTLLGLFQFYNIQLNDFWAYFHTGDNIHLTLPPYPVFNQNQYWVGTIWLEDVVYIFLLGFLGGLMLIKQKHYPLGFYVLTFLVASVFVAHRDISRYTLPVAPFVIIAFEKLLVSKTFQIALLIVLLGIYLYAQNFIIFNIAPASDLSVYN